MKYDYKLAYEKNKNFYNRHPKLKEALIKSNTILTAFFILSYFTLIGYTALSKQSPKQLTFIIFVPFLGFFLANVLRMAIEKPRPYAVGGAGITPFIEKKKADNKSFPSRHTASAFVIAMTFVAFYPPVGAFMLLSALALAYVRFALGLHYPSDLTAGALIGILSGFIALFV